MRRKCESAWEKPGVPPVVLSARARARVPRWARASALPPDLSRRHGAAGLLLIDNRRTDPPSCMQACVYQQPSSAARRRGCSFRWPQACASTRAPRSSTQRRRRPAALARAWSFLFLLLFRRRAYNAHCHTFKHLPLPSFFLDRKGSSDTDAQNSSLCCGPSTMQQHALHCFGGRAAHCLHHRCATDVSQ